MRYTIYQLKSNVNQNKYRNNIDWIDLDDYFEVVSNEYKGNHTKDELRYVLDDIHFESICNIVEAYKKVEYEYYKDINHSGIINHDFIIKLDDEYYMYDTIGSAYGKSKYHHITSYIKNTSSYKTYESTGDKKSFKKTMLAILGLASVVVLTLVGVLCSGILN